MGEIINLRQVKRRQARNEAAQAAQESRVRHGRTKAQVQADRRAELHREAAASGARLEHPDKA
jgi:hypothetical protein